jgi:glycine oxidase
MRRDVQKDIGKRRAYLSCVRRCGLSVTQPDLAVVGGGLMGRLLEWRATEAGLCVALYDAAGPTGEGSAPWVAAGMITPTAEAVDADPEIVAMGRRSLSLWPGCRRRQYRE